jgi:hypothetical protein
VQSNISPRDSIVLYNEPPLILQANFGAKRSNTMAFHKSRKRVRPSPDAEIGERASGGWCEAEGHFGKTISSFSNENSRSEHGCDTGVWVPPSITVALIGKLLPPFWQNHLEFSE